MVEQQALDWSFSNTQPESARTRPAQDLVEAIRSNRPVKVEWAIIEGDVDLHDVNYPHRLIIRHTIFNGHFDASEGRFARTVDLTACEFQHNVNFFDARIGGQLLLTQAKIRRAAAEDVPGNFSHVRVNGRLNGSLLESAVGLCFSQAAIGASAEFDGARIEGDFDFQLASVVGHLFCQSRPDRRSEIVGNVLLANVTVGGAVQFGGAKIGREPQSNDFPPIHGKLDLSDARITGDVYCNSLEIDDAGYSYRAEVFGPVLFWSATVGGDVFLDGIRIGCEAQYKDLPAVPGELNLRDANIVGDVSCSAVQSDRPRHSLRAEIHGPVSLLGAKVDGQVRLMGAEIGSHAPDPARAGEPILNLQSALITGGLFCGPKATFFTEIHGDVYTFAAKIWCTAQFDRARIHGDLDLDQTVINGLLLCAFDEERYEKNPDDPSKNVGGHFQVDGKLELTTTQAQDVVLDGRMFEPCDRNYGWKNWLADKAKAGLKSFRFAAGLFIGGREGSEQQSRLRLERTQCSKLQFREAIPDKIYADGIRVDDLELPKRRFDYTRFLKRTHPFRKSTYLALEALLLNKGLDDQAKKVYIAMSNRDLILGRNLFSRWFRWLVLGIPIGYGARPSRLSWFVLLTFLLTMWVFHHPDSLVSYHEDNPAVARECPDAAQCPAMTLRAAFRCHFPMLSFVGNPYFVPSPKPIPRPEAAWLNWLPWYHVTYQMYALVISAISWVVVPLWLAGLAGVVRQRR